MVLELIIELKNCLYAQKVARLGGQVEQHVYLLLIKI